MFIPITLKNNGTVLVIGGGRVALQKISTLLFSGVDGKNILVVAKSFINETKNLLIDKNIKYKEEAYSSRMFDEIPNLLFIVSSTNNESIRKIIFNDAKARNILINTVDAPDYSTFIFPAIIKREDVTIAINSSGKLPLFTTFVRHTIEDIFTQKLSDIYTYISKHYHDIKNKFPNPQTRRREFFHLFHKFPNLNTQTTNGHIYFASAGIGNVENVTVKTLNALRIADVILHDNLIPQGLLELSRRDAIKINVAKYGSCKAGKCSTIQENINQKIIEHAGKGEIVVRLKGGDGGIFGQLASEISAIREYNKKLSTSITYEVIAGTTTAAVAVANLGIPLTAKGLASSVTILTYHSPSQIDDDYMKSIVLRLPNETYAVYMCGKTISNFAERVISFSYSLLTMPIAILENIGGADEKVQIFTLEEVIDQTFSSPVIAIIGNVVGLLDNSNKKSKKEAIKPKPQKYSGNWHNFEGIII